MGTGNSPREQTTASFIAKDSSSGAKASGQTSQPENRVSKTRNWKTEESYMMRKGMGWKFSWWWPRIKWSSWCLKDYTLYKKQTLKHS